MNGRAQVGLFCTFALMAYMSGLHSKLPKVSYITSLDVWILTCLIFTVSTFVQLLVVQTVGHKQVNYTVVFSL